jgi:V/A-type H+/Na+-transporting ATPase subunit D
MGQMKLSKQSMQQQREQLKIYQKLLPSLDLKRRQIQVEAQKARAEHEAARNACQALDERIGAELPMLADTDFDLKGIVRLEGFSVTEQNVVGVRLPALEQIECKVAGYSRLATPAWLDILVQRLKDAAEQHVRAKIAGERVQILEQAVRRITQRVNLFEKILIPEAKSNIRRIQIFLGDVERASVVTSKLAKAKMN